ncbi:putative glycoside hydrolase [Paenibacillus senegalensis]|uniref:putative glycoside hydrolase n=1 Tax=Paenibacillus senegalensis TaxID=1465766 RepID=UPI000288C142|nr:putative glycoside hydrolase [Paenibacillus senegalensis]
MEMLLAALMIIWGNMTTADADIELSFEQLVQASSYVAQMDDEQFDPLVPWYKSDPQPDAPTVRGIYATAHSAAGARMDSLLELIDSTELNAMVIDIKDDWGYITYQTGNPVIEAYEAEQRIIPDIEALMQRLNEHDVYPIARIVVFKDTVLAKKRQDLSFSNPDGSLWANNKSSPESFVNPYLEEVWDYNIEVAKEAVKAGFKEIQFDYVRFPEGFEKRADLLQYAQDERSRIDAVAGFVKKARDELAPLGVRISVDIFGYAASVPAAEGIGQDFVKISQNVDVISPMVYPSHYTTGWYGAKVPDAEPYNVIAGSSVDTHNKLDPLGELKPIIRPWIQDFTATWVPGHIKYGKHEVEEQIRALKDNGIDEFLLWNSGNRYTSGVNYIP